MIRSTTVLSLVLTALKIILYIQLRSKIDHQFLIWVVSPFFGINLRLAVRKLGDSTPVSKQCNEYFSSGTLRYSQNFLIKALFIPSGPAAVLVFVADSAASSSPGYGTTKNNKQAAGRFRGRKS